MTNRHNLLFVLLLFSVLLLPACGRHEGGPADPSGAVDLSEVKSFDEATAPPGTSISFNLTGEVCSYSTGTNCNNVSGTFSSTITGPTYSNDKQYNVAEQVFIISNLTTTSTTTTTSYVLLDGKLDMAVSDDGTNVSVGTVTEQNLLRARANVGESGRYVTLSFSNGDTETNDWRIDSGASNGDAIIVFKFVRMDGSNNILFTQEVAQTIKPDGAIYDMSLTSTEYSAGTAVATIQLYGPRAAP